MEAFLLPCAGYGVSPEKRAANHLHDFFNFIAVKIVVAQLQVPSKFYPTLYYIL